MTSQKFDQPSVPVLDQSRLLQEFGDDPEVLEELRRLFLEHIPPLIDEIRTALTTGDGERAARSAHSLKGAVSTYGGMRLAGLCKTLELTARNGDLAGAAEILPRMMEESDLLLTTIRQLSDPR